jgi:hypothetical protein
LKDATNHIQQRYPTFENRPKRRIMNRRLSDLISGLICMICSIGGIIILEKSELLTWVIIIFFGIGAILLLLRYFNPNSKFLPKQKEEYKELTEQEFNELYNSNGVFTYNQNGFELPINEELNKISWNEINKMTAYKIDLLTSDEICLFVQAKNGKQFEITESTKGWFQFIQKIKEQFPNISKTWEIEIANPAFERKETELYNRNK